MIEMNESNQPATKQDVIDTVHEATRDIRLFILEREVQSIRWFVGTQVAYFAITLGAVYFMLAHLPK
jgi:hypothetical protein